MAVQGKKVLDGGTASANGQKSAEVSVEKQEGQSGSCGVNEESGTGGAVGGLE